MCVCVCTHWGLQFREVWGCFVCSGRKGMPKSNTVNRMPREGDGRGEKGRRAERVSRHTARRKMGRDREQRCIKQQTERANKRKEEGAPEKNSARKQIFHLLPLMTANSIPLTAIGIPADRQGGVYRLMSCQVENHPPLKLYHEPAEPVLIANDFSPPCSTNNS